ncbi:MAG: hypothetical protein JXR48_05325 [Candidatus Delongbacteria bacterium]|nr:hypothetical protein [Candidatus Delongbacteria bacterium]MBN2834370.1 hypothetical protein [Candidatus Delongbacteria bacterium]
MKNTVNKKANVLVIAIMITTVMFILVSGTYIISKNGLDRATESTNDYELYWSAHAGYVHTMVNMKNIPNSSLNISIGDTLSLSTDDSLSNFNNGVSVKTRATKTSSGFTLTSTAKKDGKFVKIENTALNVQSLIKYSECIQTMGYEGSWTTGYNFWGDVFVNSNINISDNPRFYGDVVTAAIKSPHLTAGKSVFETSGWNASPPREEFGLGIHDLTNRSSVSSFTDIFKKKYSGDNPGETLSDVAMNWTEITTAYPSSDTRRYSIGDKNTTINLKKKIVGSDTLQYADIKIGSNWNLDVDLSGIDVITVDNGSKNTKIKGEVCSELTIVTKESNIIINGDIYYSEVADMISKTTDNFKADRETFVYDNLVNKMTNNNHFLGLIAGAGLSSTTSSKDFGCIRVVDNDDTDNETPLIVTAAMVASYGQIFADDPSKWAYEIPFLTLGSIIANEEGSTSSSSVGVMMNPITDKRLKNGFVPKTFKLALKDDGSINFSTGNWKVSRGSY